MKLSNWSPHSGPRIGFSSPPESGTGLGYFRQEKCNSCHAVAGRGATIGPDLAHTTTNHRNAAWMIEHFKNPSVVRPGTSMPPIDLSSGQMNSLSAFLLKLTPDNGRSLFEDTPDFAVQGAMVFEKYMCVNCHKVNGNGTSVGPPLNGVGRRRTRDWVREHFADPKTLRQHYASLQIHAGGAGESDHLLVRAPVGLELDRSLASEVRLDFALERYV